MEERAWLEVSLTVDGELAEAVSEVLARFTPEGVVIESTNVTANAEDAEGRAVGPLRVSAYLSADAQLESNRHRLEEALWYLGRIQPLPAPQYRLVQQADWSETWKQHFRPIPIGQYLMVVPAWLEPDTAGRVAIKIDPGMAFGTGTHPTTQLCLEMVEEVIAPAGLVNPARGNVIDIGCGSGILAIAALKLGAPYALGVDIDAEAISAARQNAELNGVSERLEARQGSLNEIRQKVFSISQAELVLANILAPVLVRMLQEDLADIITPSGSLVLSGILAEQSLEVETALAEHNLMLTDKRQIDDWVALMAKKQTIANL